MSASWKNQVEEFCGTLIATPEDPVENRTLNETVYEYVAKFPLQEDFEDVVSTREEEITDYECNHVEGECFAYFNTQEVEPYSDY